MAGGWQQVEGEVVQGHGVASGVKEDPRFPGGTLAMQLPFFAQHGLDLSGFHLATMNVSITPLHYRIGEPRFTIRDLKWHSTEPAEDFSFVDCRVSDPETGGAVEALIYYPHPETKPEHEQPDDVLEILARKKLSGVEYGSRLKLEVAAAQMTILE
ncbi:MAG: hypothetical protein HKN23_17075 [Verrucomicrobiales bacterium]|nr:hypothetical protein [Verrucomicrobiales bacterium]